MISTDGYNNVDQFGDGYMEQEEEWEREGLLDPAWEKQQKKVSEMDFFKTTAFAARLRWRNESELCTIFSLFFEFAHLIRVNNTIRNSDT